MLARPSPVRSWVQTKLTLRLDDHLVRAAKRHAKRAGCFRLAAGSGYFAVIAAAEARPSTSMMAPKVSGLMGVLEGSGVDDADYRAHLERKYL